MKILDSADGRPETQKQTGMTVTTFRQVWSGDTVPEADEYLASCIIQETEESGLFQITEDAEYQLSGTVKSLEAERMFGYMGFAGVGLAAANGDIVNAYVEYAVVLSGDGKEIWRETIAKEERGSYRNPIAFVPVEKMSQHIAVVLDRAISISVREMVRRLQETPEEKTT